MTHALSTAQAAIAAKLSEATGWRARALHTDRVDLEELTREAHGAPCVLVTLPEVSLDARIAGEVVVLASWSAYVLAEARDPQRRADETLSAVEAVIRTAAMSDFDGTMDAVAESLSAQNLYSGDLDGLSVALWAVRWRQAVCVDAADASDISALHRFRTITASFAPPAEEGSATTDTACSACGEADASNEEEQNHE